MVPVSFKHGSKKFAPFEYENLFRDKLKKGVQYKLRRLLGLIYN